MVLGEVPLSSNQDSQANQRLNQLSKVPFMDGIKLENVNLTSGTNQVQHKLNRQIIGYFILRKSAQSQISDVKSASEDKTISLVCSSDVVVDLWVF